MRLISTMVDKHLYAGERKHSEALGRFDVGKQPDVKHRKHDHDQPQPSAGVHINDLAQLTARSGFGEQSIHSEDRTKYNNDNTCTGLTAVKHVLILGLLILQMVKFPTTSLYHAGEVQSVIQYCVDFRVFCTA
ncbi:hypothetical protein CSKR_106197 [Clonorchis sinensis]|uniref:Uncharacterized protein n=2 Tax=Clonorchis sinensis TaxID=79923 RepID=G7YVC9_CLOSI|nr:hypothetical protein CSKR_106197 [Clonorchis sinensis]GAA56909.1 hypothetical protein CLF_111805 [Clonorchis sinensis]